MLKEKMLLFPNLTYKNICIFKVIPPVWSNLSLTSYVPNIQFKTRRDYRFDIKSLKERVHHCLNTWYQLQVNQVDNIDLCIDCVKLIFHSFYLSWCNMTDIF